MKKPYRLLSTAAVTLLFTAGAASAQMLKKDESPAASPRAQQSAPPAAQQKAPAEKIAPPMQSVQDRGGAKPAETTGQAPKASDSNQPRASDKGAKDKGASGKSMEKEPAARSGGADMKGNKESTQAPAAPATPRSSQSTTTEQRGTTGQGAAGAARLSTEQRTRITTVIKQQNVQRVEPSRLNISIRVGARVPSTVRFYPLPVEVIAVYPEWRGYLYILVGDEILVVHPRTHEIVAILEA